MSVDFDVIIVGSGPAGVSSAFPLVQAGLRVMMVDGGKQATVSPPPEEYLFSRENDPAQWKWMVGEDFHALKNLTAVSPKLRTTTNKYVFDEFETVNQIKSNNFITVGSLATGGLSNAWGCGVASLSENELSDFPFQHSDIIKSYGIISKRIGISGGQNDDMSDYFGLDAWSQPPIKMDELHSHIYSRYLHRRSKAVSNHFRLGRSRLAVLSEDIADRKSCDISGNCLWGCHRKTLYSAVDDLELLKQYESFNHKSGFIVDDIRHNNNFSVVEGFDGEKQSRASITADIVLLAAGTLATTRFALKALKYRKSVPLLSCPTAAFLLWMPRFLGRKHLPAFGLGQLSFSLSLKNDVTAFGSTFSTTGIPASEFARHLPLHQRYGIDFLRGLLSSCVVGNVFLPGHFSSAKATLMEDGALMIDGGYEEQVSALMRKVALQLKREYWRLGALLLPKSFTVGSPGGDIHYAGTLPMVKSRTSLTHTNSQGELHGLRGIHVVDGACLSTLSEKSHTLTIMANADRIGRKLAVTLNCKRGADSV